jgi:hypothetical protein
VGRWRKTLTAAALAVSLIAAPAAHAGGAKGGTGGIKIVTNTFTKTVVASTNPVLVSNLGERPAGFRLRARQAERIASKVPVIENMVRHHRGVYPAVYTDGAEQWQVSWFSRKGTELGLEYVDDLTGEVTQAWTGFQIAWSMARGYPGSFGHNLNHPWVWIPLCLLFMAPFVPLPWPFPRRLRPAGPRWSLLQLDLLVLLGFSVSLAFFNHGNLGLSVPLAYPFLLYLMIRMLMLAFGRGRPKRPLRLSMSAYVMVVLLAAMIGFRTYSNIKDSGVIDVGYAGVIGADRLLHGEKLYGTWPSSNPTGDTYGPVNYYAYVPFRAIFGWSGTWDSLPAGHAAAIAFDLLTMLCLFLLGRRVRGPDFGVLLAYLWGAYPFTFYVLQSSSNDSLVSLLLVLTLLAFSSKPARGAAAALAGFVKFAQFALAPLFWRGIGDTWPRGRRLLSFPLAFAVTSGVVMLPVILTGDFHRFWEDTIVRQFHRTSPFSIWGLWGGLSIEQHLVQGACAVLAVVLAFVPRRRSIYDLSALAAAVTIAFQLGLTHWFYLYIVWFFPLVAFALLGSHPDEPADAAEVAQEANRPAPLIPAPAGITPDSTDFDDQYNHFSLLASIEELFGLKRLGYAADIQVPVFNDGTYNAFGG